jgi:2-iminobutanoate/2-iminopropanoate deaminase
MPAIISHLPIVKLFLTIYATLEIKGLMYFTIMEKKRILSAQAPAPIGPYSQAINTGNFLFVSGQIPLDIEGNFHNNSVEEECEQVMKNLEAVLSEAGMSFSNVVKTSIFLLDMNDFGKVNEIYSRYFSADPPARETIQVAGLPKGAKVEISVIAVG